MFSDKKALVAQVSLVFLMLLTIIAFFQVSQWYNSYQSNLDEETEEVDFERNIEIAKVDGSKVFISNQFRDNVNLSSIRINDFECDIDDVMIDRGLAIVDIADCTAGLEQVTSYDVSLVTDFGVKYETEILRNFNSSFLTISYELTPCDISSDFIELFSLSSFNNSHVELNTENSYSYRACARHKTRELGTNNSGANQLLFNLFQPTNSHVFTSTTSAYSPPSQWYPVHISASGGEFSYYVGSEAPNSTYACIGSLDVDNVYGAHFGDCDSSHSSIIWLSLT